MWLKYPEKLKDVPDMVGRSLTATGQGLQHLVFTYTLQHEWLEEIIAGRGLAWP